ncbi:hypothetical protein F5Y16DRAFT_365191 [Xylariaceae sp. FL0255]|nr:hypothetical protein F5Y16DRAFT_365191 [Xylariaceae sp. FL0255]
MPRFAFAHSPSRGTSDTDASEKMFHTFLRTRNRGRARLKRALRERQKSHYAWTQFCATIEVPGPPQIPLKQLDVWRAIKSFPAYCNPRNTSVFLSQPAPGINFSFLSSFPPEIRNRIYQYLAQYPTSFELRETYYRHADSSGKPGSPALYTPTILLLCKQVTREALSCFRLEWFVIDRITPWLLGEDYPIPYTQLISKETLQNLRFVELKLSLGNSNGVLSGKVWLESLDSVLRAWSEKNCLVLLKVMIKIHHVKLFLVHPEMRDDYRRVVRTFNEFAFRHGATPDLVQFEHWIMDDDYAFNWALRENRYYLSIRNYPDPYIWQGNVLDWLR